MSESTFYNGLIIFWFGLSLVIFLSLYFVTAPYGRHSRGGWGPKINSTAGWVIMEMPSAIGMVILFILSARTGSVVLVALLALWQLHYWHRTFVYPFRRRGKARPMPLTIPLMAIAFNVGNVYLNGRWLTALGPVYETSWLWDPRFILGATLFLIGFAVNFQSDSILFGLRKPGETGYQIPRGGLYRAVSCPNYFGELLEWTGWAIATWSLAGVAFAVWTAANLVPRAISHHRWYREQFPNYPPERKAVIPYLY